MFLLPGIPNPGFRPAFSIRPGQNGSSVSDGHTMTAACFTGKLPGLVIIHGVTPSVNHQYRVAFIHKWEVPGQTRKIFDPAWF